MTTVPAELRKVLIAVLCCTEDYFLYTTAVSVYAGRKRSPKKHIFGF